jgi:multidrug resistance efflux pump
VHGTDRNLHMPSDNTILRSIEISEMMDGRPGRFTRWGATVCLTLLMIIGFLSWLVHYPDIITAKAKLQAINAPKEIIAMQSGKLESLLVRDGDSVAAEQVIGWIESTARHVEVFQLDSMLNTLETMVEIGDWHLVETVRVQSFRHLGELQSNYQSFQTAFLSFRNYLDNGFFVRKKTYLSKEIGYLQKMKGNLQQQQRLQTQDLGLQQQSYQANEKLGKEKVIAPLEVNKELSALIGKQMSVPQISSNIIQNESQQNAKRLEIADLDNQVTQQKNLFTEALHTLHSQVTAWKRKYVLVTPVAGRFSFNGFLQEKQTVQQNQSVGMVLSGNTSFYAEIVIPQQSFGKTAIGQTVQLKLDGFPFEQYGFLKGQINFVSVMGTDSGFQARVVIPNGLMTTYGKSISFRQGLTAIAEIITEDKRLFDRMTERLRGLVSK